MSNKIIASPQDLEPYSVSHEIVNYVFTVEDLIDLTTYGGEEPRYFSNEAVDQLAGYIKDAINETISDFLSNNL